MGGPQQSRPIAEIITIVTMDWSYYVQKGFVCERDFKFFLDFTGSQRKEAKIG